KIQEYQGTLADGAQTLVEVLQLQDELSERLGKLYTYAHMRADQDTTNTFYQALESRAETILTLAASSMSFIVPEILSMDEATLNRFLEENEALQRYRHTLDEINRQRPHVLSQREEALLAEASEPLGSASQTFNMLNNADMTFPTIQNEKGEDV